MTINKFGTLLIFIILHLDGFTQSDQEKLAADYPDYLFEVTKVMVHDIINPPAAARYYAYSNLAAYLALGEDELVHDVISPFNARVSKKVDLQLSAIYALIHTARMMLPSGETLLATELELLGKASKDFGLSKKTISSSREFGEKAAEFIVDHSKSDGYAELSSYVGYTPRQTEGSWYPTPPAYIEAIEPHWTTLRTFYLDSSTQFVPDRPIAFSLDTTSDFYQEQLMGVYNAVKNRTKEEEEMAKFWDCNPFEVKFVGHVTIGMKKITPGGHWMGITGIATKTAGFNFNETVRAHTLVALSLHDAFVSCWDEKYRSDRIRPETVINQHIDDEWKPVLQTPPFPEYTSGHSVASGAASTVLTYIFGDDFTFTDDTETYFGLPTRQFESFNHAAEEAAISRLYGGIHYIDACEIGLDQGRKIGDYIVKKINK